MMRILQINTEKTWRGGERQTLLTMIELRSAGHQVELLCAQKGGLSQRVQDAGFVVHELASGLGFWAWLMVRGRQYDILHAQTAKAMTWAALAKWFNRRPLVFTKRTSFPLKRGVWQTRWKWHQANQVVAISQAAAQAPKQLGVAVEVIASAVPPIAANPVRIKTFLGKHQLVGKRLVGTAGALSFEKDPLTLINAAAEVCRVLDDVVFIHWGADESAAEAVRARIAELGLQQRYLLMGFEHAVQELYPALSVFVMASVYEALGSSVLDAMLQQVPVVSTDAGGLKEVVSEGRGLVVSVGDAQAMASQILLVLSGADSIKPMVHRAFSDVQAHYGVAEMAQRYLGVYQRFVGR